MQSDSIGFSLSRAMRSWRARINRELEPQGITYATWFTLIYLDQGTGMLQKDLAQFMGIEAPTLVRRLDLLESDGLIERQPSISDRRAKTVLLTDRALQVLDAVTHVTDEVRRDILADIPASDLALCQAVLDRIIDNATRDDKTRPRDGGGKDD